jgi:hypothetical protein
METKLATETAEFIIESSMNVSRAMVGGIAGNGGRGGSTEFVKVVPFWVLVDYVG